MKPGILLFAFMAILSCSRAQDIDYNNLNTDYRNLASQALNKVSPATRKWFAEMAQQHADSMFNVAWAKQKLYTKFSGKDVDLMGDLFVLMMAYQKIMNKEAREDRKLARSDARIELDAKASKLETDKTKIDQQKREAAEKADRAMEAANTQLVTGTVSANAQIAASQANGNAATSISTVKKDSLKTLQQKANLQDQKIKQQELNTEKANEQKKGSQDHRKAQSDAIRKLLDQLAELNRNTQI